MKLYATVTSERASKGQGGNEWLAVDFTVGDAENPISFGRILLDLRKNEEGFPAFVLQYNGSEIASYPLNQVATIKGKRQKGEISDDGKNRCVHHKDGGITIEPVK